MTDQMLQNLLSGLVGAIIGAAVGGLVTFAAQDREHELQRKAAVRAVFYELTGNAAIVQSIGRGAAAIGPASSHVWDTLMPIAIGALGNRQVVDVASAYMLLPELEKLRLAIAAGREDPVSRAVVLNMYLGAFQQGANAIRPLVKDAGQLAVEAPK
jgi:hypothetical protein